MVDVPADNGQPPEPQPSEPGNSYSVGPPTPVSPPYEPACFSPEPDVSLDAAAPPKERFQFSLAEMFLVITLAAVVLSFLGYLVGPAGFLPGGLHRGPPGGFLSGFRGAKGDT